MSAMATYSDGSTADVTTLATWASSNTNALTVGAHTGVVIPVASSGGSNITATFDGAVGGPAHVDVDSATASSVTITPAAATVTQGGTQQFIATASVTDGSTCDVTYAPWTVWQSSAPTVATVSSTGLATGVGAGSATVQATSGISAPPGTATLTVQ
jgi:hypothetical protein